MDVRKSWNKKLPSNTLTIDTFPYLEAELINKPVPIMFGSWTVDALCTNGTLTTGEVEYKVCEYLTSVSRVDLYDGDTLAVSGANISTSSLTEGIIRVGNRGPEGKPFDARVTCTGYADTSVLGVIKQLELLANDVAYTESFFDTAEIESELGSLEAIAVYIDKQAELYELIRQLQEGCSNRFRYEVNAEGKRTARLDDLDRVSSAYVAKEEILENETMAIYTDKATIAAKVKINWGKSGLEDTYQTVIDESREGAVARSARETPQIEFNTFLATREHATARAALEAERLGQVRRFTDCTLRGAKFLSLRIYDIITVELLDEYREWAGTWRCQVLAIGPDTANEQNRVTLLLVERVADIDDGKILRITDTGAIRKTTTSDDIVRVTNG